MSGALTEVFTQGMGSSMGLVTEVGGALAGVTAIAAGVSKSKHVVPEGQMGIRIRGGRKARIRGIRPSHKPGTIYGVEPAGMHRIIPFFADILDVDCRDRVDDLEPFPVTRQGDRQYDIRGRIIWGIKYDVNEQHSKHSPNADVKNLYKAIFDIQDANALTRAVVGTCMSGLRKIMMEINNFEDNDIIDNAVKMRVNADLENDYGCELRRLNLLSTSETAAQKLSDGMTVGACGRAAMTLAETDVSEPHLTALPKLNIANSV